jgi:hypothetical protein
MPISDSRNIPGSLSFTNGFTHVPSHVNFEFPKFILGGDLLTRTDVIAFLAKQASSPTSSIQFNLLRTINHRYSISFAFCLSRSVLLRVFPLFPLPLQVDFGLQFRVYLCSLPSKGWEIVFRYVSRNVRLIKRKIYILNLWLKTSCTKLHRSMVRSQEPAV